MNRPFNPMVLSILLGMTACAGPSLRASTVGLVGPGERLPLASPEERAGWQSPERIPEQAAGPLRGRVDFGTPASRGIQATMDEVALNATVSLIDTASNKTIASGLTDANGSFLIVFTPSFEPDPARVYLVEAVKGLKNNRPANSAARIRTFVQYDAGWKSIANGEVGLVPIGAPTTAIAVGAELRNGAAAGSVDLLSLVGSYDPTADSYTPASGLSSADYTSILAIVRDTLAEDTDPVARVALRDARWVKLNDAALTITGMTPTTGAAGTEVVLAGFFPSAGPIAVAFSGVPGTVMSSSSTSIHVTAPDFAVSGPVVVTADGLSSEAGIFSYALSLIGLEPAAGIVGSRFSVRGGGFGARGDATVSVGTMAAVVESTDTDALAALVPTWPAGTRSVKVEVTGQTGVVPASFTVKPSIEALSALEGKAGHVLQITGAGFDPDPGRNRVFFSAVEGTVTGANPRAACCDAISLTVKVPAMTATDSAPVSVQVNGLTASGPAIRTIALVTELSTDSVAVGSSVSVSGSGFHPQAGRNVVTFAGGVTGAVSSVSAGALTVSVPAGAISGPLYLAVDGLPAVAAGQIRVPVTVSAISPLMAAPGASLTVTGSGFSVTPGLNTVLFEGGATASVTWASPTSLKVVIPQAVSSGTITVIVAGQEGESSQVFKPNFMEGTVLR